MKKILLTLICIPLLFNSCKKDKSSAPSTICGSATVTVDGVNYTLTNPQTYPAGDCIIFTGLSEVNGTLSGLAISMINMETDNITTDWTINAQMSTPFNSIGTPININQTYSANNDNLGQTHIGNMIFTDGSGAATETFTNGNSGLINGEITITNIDYANETIDGEFSFTGYSVNAPMPGGSTSHQISCVFSDIPFFL